MSIEDKKKYLDQKLNPILNEIVVAILSEMPSNPIDFIKKWIANYELRQPQGGTEESEPEEVPKKLKVFRARHSVSSEAYGLFNIKKEFVPKVVPKSREQIQRIQATIMKSFIFSTLDQKDLDTVVGTMEEKRLAAGEYVIKQGDDGNQLYIVESGELDCYKKFQPDVEDTFLKTYTPGESFGELSLLYNVPRQASIKCKTDTILWTVDRDAFTNIIRDSAMKRRQKYDEFLEKVELFKGMDKAERSKIIDTLKPVNFCKDTYVVKEGETGCSMYLVEEGELTAVKWLDGEQKTVMQYHTGDYFGEIALVNKIARQASVVCKSNCTLLEIDKDTFERLISCNNPTILKNMEKYEGFKNKKE